MARCTAARARTRTVRYSVITLEILGLALALAGVWVCISKWRKARASNYLRIPRWPR